MIKIALVGDIGSGKSFFSKLFKYPIFNADLEISKIYKNDKNCIKNIKKTFPKNKFSFPLKKEELIDAFMGFQKSQNYPIIKLSNTPLVSMDYIGEKYSAIVDTRWLDIINSELIKIVLWYDNEYGYSCNVINH